MLLEVSTGVRLSLPVLPNVGVGWNKLLPYCCSPDARLI